MKRNLVTDRLFFSYFSRWFLIIPFFISLFVFEVAGNATNQTSSDLNNTNKQNTQVKAYTKNRATTKQTARCAENQFACTKCIHYINVCDYENDCGDHSDENDCDSIENYTGGLVQEEPKSGFLCALPKQAIDQSYQIDCYNGTWGRRLERISETHVMPFAILTYICNPGYTRKTGNNIFETYCQNGKWSPTVPKCQRICQRLFPSNDLEIECYRSGEKVNCNEPMLSGTEVRATCKPYRRQIGGQTNHRIVCTEGRWNATLPECVLECGKMEGNDSSWIVLGNAYNYNHFPWHVAIYDVGYIPTLICAGTIISPIMIVTATACVIDVKTKKTKNVDDIEIVVSKTTPDYNFQDNEFQKSYKIHKIFIAEFHDVAILEVTEEISFSYAVSPACYESKTSDVAVDMQGQVASWGIIDINDVHETDFRIDTYLTKEFGECTNEENKFCGQQTYGAGTNVSDAGAGFIYYNEKTQRYHVMGVMNTKYKFKNNFVVICSHLNYKSTKRWIDVVSLQVMNQRIIDNAGKYFKTRPECEYETIFDAKLQKAVVCSTRKKNDVIPPCKRACSKLVQPENMELTCTYDDITMNCDQELTSGVRVTFSCKDGYKPLYDLEYEYIECQENGKWSNELFPCIQNDIKSCALPPISKDKTYTIDCQSNGSNAESDKFVKELTMLAFQCNPGYYYQETAPENKNFSCGSDRYYSKKLNNFQVICVDGLWTPKIRNCSKLCKMFTTINMKPECYYNDQVIDCNQPLFAGTRMRPLCQKNYRKKYVTDFEELTCKENGEWDNFPVECIPECGKNMVSENTNNNAEIPFHISIMEKKTGSPICAGTLITPYLVLTAARCFYDPVAKRLGKADSYEIIAGKKIKRLSSSLNKNVLQYTNFRKSYQAKTIYYTNKGKNKIVGNYTEDLAVIESVEKIELNVNTIPACVNWLASDKLDLAPYHSFNSNNENAQSGHVAKWGNDYFENDGTYIGSEILLATYLHYEYGTCKNLTMNDGVNNSDLFCLYKPGDQVLFSKNHSFETSDYGSGFIQVRGDWNLYHVQGVLSAKTANESFYQMINVNYHANWLNRIRLHVERRRVLEETRKYFDVDIFHRKDECEDVLSNLKFGSDPEIKISCKGENIKRYFSNGCYLPERKTYRIDYEHSCPKNNFQNYCKSVGENGSVPELTKLTYSCIDGYAVPKTALTQNLVSFCNGKWQPSLSQCKKYCKKLKPINMKLTCYYDGAPISCETHLGQNTVVVPECLREYEPESNPKYKEIVCLASREWSDTLYRCKPKCGRSSSNVTTLIRGGHDALFGEFPWHVAIYDVSLNNSLICGGSIISPYAIISAAHCFFDQFNNALKPAKNYVIAVGKISRDFNKRDSEVTAFYEVEKIIVENFLGRTLRYQYDIAMLRIKTKIIFNAQVIPICLRQSSTTIIPSGEILHVCGWGVDDTDRHSSILRVATMPYLSISECVKRAPEHIIEYISVDKFCVQNVNGSIVDRGDSGGGVSRLDKATSLHYLVGIVSFKAVELPTFAVITDATQDNYVRWISKHMNEIHRVKQYDV